MDFNMDKKKENSQPCMIAFGHILRLAVILTGPPRYRFPFAESLFRRSVKPDGGSI